MNENIIKEKIKELDKNNLIETIFINDSPIEYDNDFDRKYFPYDFIIIRLVNNFEEYPLGDFNYSAFVALYFDKKKELLSIRTEDNRIYIEDEELNNIPLILFAYNNKDKIEDIIKEALKAEDKE